MILEGKKYLANFNFEKIQYTVLISGGRYEKKSTLTREMYEGEGIIEVKMNNERYAFEFETEQIQKEEERNLEKFLINTGNIKIPENKRQNLIDLVLEEIFEKVKGYTNGFRAKLSFQYRKIERAYLEEKGILDEKDGQKRIIFD